MSKITITTARAARQIAETHLDARKVLEAGTGNRGDRLMKLIDPHIHCVSRTTDDYLYMARAGVVAVSGAGVLGGV